MRTEQQLLTPTATFRSRPVRVAPYIDVDATCEAAIRRNATLRELLCLDKAEANRALRRDTPTMVLCFGKRVRL